MPNGRVQVKFSPLAWTMYQLEQEARRRGIPIDELQRLYAELPGKRRIPTSPFLAELYTPGGRMGLQYEPGEFVGVSGRWRW